ncbi:transposable element Tcb1 transposase [Trichonephila clavipes]|nr:transposable element Tcb1 transposase [Trichonephila clavipes]
MQKGMTDRRGRSHPQQCNTSREDRQIVHMTVTDLSVTSRTVAHHIEHVTHHSVSARTIRHRLQQSGLSARRTLLGLPLTQNHRRLRRQWCDERRMWAAEWNEVVLTDESRICLQHHDGWIRVWGHCRERILNSCVMHCHTGPAPGIMELHFTEVYKFNHLIPGLHVIYKINFVVLSLVFLGVAFTVASSVDSDEVRLSESDDCEESDESVDIIDYIPVNPDIYIARDGTEWIAHNSSFLADLRLEMFCDKAVFQPQLHAT